MVIAVGNKPKIAIGVISSIVIFVLSPASPSPRRRQLHRPRHVVVRR